MTLRRLESFIGRSVLDVGLTLLLTVPGHYLIYRAAEPSDRLMVAAVLTTIGGYCAAKVQAWMDSKHQEENTP